MYTTNNLVLGKKVRKNQPRIKQENEQNKWQGNRHKSMKEKLDVGESTYEICQDFVERYERKGARNYDKKLA